MILLLDNVDSFVHNLARYLVRLGHETQVVRTYDASVGDVRARRPDAVLFSPGPCAPTDDSPAVTIVRELWRTIPMLGICLGHQQIVHALGGQIKRAAEPIHGRDSAICHDGQREFAELPNPFPAARYHSLVSSATVPESLEVSARTDQDVVMAVRAREYPVFGWQFHPESILTPHGFDLLRGFLRESGLPATKATTDSERSTSNAEKKQTRNQRHPITF